MIPGNYQCKITSCYTFIKAYNSRRHTTSAKLKLVRFSKGRKSRWKVTRFSRGNKSRRKIARKLTRFFGGDKSHWKNTEWYRKSLLVNKSCERGFLFRNKSHQGGTIHFRQGQTVASNNIQAKNSLVVSNLLTGQDLNLPDRDSS